jgi:hypothetical protein
MTQERRAQITADRIRRGSVPMPTGDRRREITAGYGQPCDGCAETIHTTEEQHLLTVVGTVTLRFHEECYSAWVLYKAK